MAARFGQPIANKHGKQFSPRSGGGSVSGETFADYAANSRDLFCGTSRRESAAAFLRLADEEFEKRSGVPQLVAAR
ncbi:MAG: hypothetical protein WB460_14275 [Candidatus Acidiferrales bacterium]